jgi:hypothetical protein
VDRKRPTPESAAGSAGASAAAPETEAATPMERFRSLTRRLLDVSREQLAEEQRKYERGKAKRPAKPD